MMKLAKLGQGLGFGMMGLGCLGIATVKASPAQDPMGSAINETSGSLIVFGAAIAFVSIACSESTHLARAGEE